MLNRPWTLSRGPLDLFKPMALLLLLLPMVELLEVVKPTTTQVEAAIDHPTHSRLLLSPKVVHHLQSRSFNEMVNKSIPSKVLESKQVLISPMSLLALFDPAKSSNDDNSKLLLT